LRLLLDTHIWLWALPEPSRLSRRVREETRKPDNELWLSPVSTWEVLLLNAQGRIRLPVNLRSGRLPPRPPCGRRRSPTRLSSLLSSRRCLIAIPPTGFWQRRLRSWISRWSLERTGCSASGRFVP
jgi:hypothetical protein